VDDSFSKHYIISFSIYYVIPISSFMYRSKILNQLKLDCFLKFVDHELNSEMVKSEMVVLTRRENAYVAVGWKLQPTAGTIVGKKESES
jgi:hypothetical protein